MNDASQSFWSRYLESLETSARPTGARIEARQAGDVRNADELLALYLEGKKKAGSSLEASFLAVNDPLPCVGDYWIILDARNHPRCLVKTVGVERHLFNEVPERVAIAEGEGELSIHDWRKTHRTFFEPYLEELKIKDINDAAIITEFYQVLFTSSLNPHHRSIDDHE